MHRRALLIALVCAVLAVSLFALYLRQYEKESSGGERVRVLVALRALERGQPLSEDALTFREVPQAYVEDRSIRASDKTKVVGLRVGGLVQAQQTLMWTDLAAASEDRRDLSALVSPGRRAMTTRFRDDGASSMVRPGDYVDVIGVLSPGGFGSEARTASVLLQRVLVLAVGSSMSADPPGDPKFLNDSRGQLTLSVTLQEAQLLAAAAERSTLSVALRNVDDGQTMDRIPDVGPRRPNEPRTDDAVAARRSGPTELPSTGESAP